MALDVEVKNNEDVVVSCSFMTGSHVLMFCPEAIKDIVGILRQYCYLSDELIIDPSVKEYVLP